MTDTSEIARIAAIDHTCLACGDHHPGASEVTLHDGRVVSSYSEAWRHESEARDILAMPKKLDRWKALEAVEQRRGKKTADALQALVRKLWELRTSRAA